MKKVSHASSITVRSGGHNTRDADMWMAGFTPPLPLQIVRPGWTSDFPQRDKRKTGESNCLPHSTAIIIFFLAHRSCGASLPSFL
jgi:hypothetical protein